MENKCWCPKCQKFQNFTNKGKCIKCNILITFLQYYIDSDKKITTVWLDLYEQSEEYYG